MKRFLRFFLVYTSLSTLLPAAAMAQSEPVQMTNLVIFVRFADDDEIDKNLRDIDPMFNSREPGYNSVANYYDAVSYGRVNLHTYYADQVNADSTVVSYTDPYPRGHFMPYSETNPDGYTDEVPLIGIHARERALLARITDYIDQHGLVADTCPLDGNGDGMIDNVSFVVKGGVGAWASILWPHMEFFPQDSVDHPVQINGYRLNCFNMEFEQSAYFRVKTFCHEIGHSLGAPDFYHYTDYTNIQPVGPWDLMANGVNVHPSAIVKYKYLHFVDPPMEITEDGTYTLNSVGSSPSQNLYYIRSAIDTTQWYTLEYRNPEDPFESGLPGGGLLIGRWADTTTTSNMYMGNAFFHHPDHAHSYWVFRPGSDYDTLQGHLNAAAFDGSTGHNTFSAATDPHPYLTDGTPENSFEIYDIQPNGTTCSFSVRFTAPEGIDETTAVRWRFYPNPATHGIHITLPAGERQTLLIHDALGRCVMRSQLDGGATYLPLHLPQGIYTLTIGEQREKMVVKTKK